ncbi:MAG: zinc-ribbon domain-containing protein [Oscillospiraceae bacterium]|nr:zinc-ribbon domain-containing protein [Oscillospiraceae bacterium]
MITCPKCNKELSDGTTFCDNCGAQLFENVFCPNCGEQTSTEFAFCQSCGAPIGEASGSEKPSIVNKMKGLLDKALANKKILFGGIAVVVLILLISLFSGGKSKQNFALYIKDKEVYYAELKNKPKAWEVTSKLTADTNDSNDFLSSIASNIEDHIKLSKDGKTIIFPDKLEGTSSYNLYFRKVEKKKDAEKIDSEVIRYSMNENFSIITYLKGSDRNLYQATLGKDNKEKIASNVSSYFVSDNAKKIYILDNEGNLYLKSGKKDKEKLCGDVSSIVYVSENFKTVYFVKDGDLYKQVGTKDKVKIDSDYSSILWVYESGEMYYTTFDEEESNYTLHYYNGKKSFVISEEYDFTNDFAADKAVICYNEISEDDDPTVCIAVGKKSYTAKLSDEATEITISNDGKTLYYFDNVENSHGDMYSASISKSKLGKSKKIDSDVYDGRITFMKKSVIYFKDVKDSTGEMYFDGKKVDFDVYIYSLQRIEDSKRIFYTTDLDSGDGTGTLKVLQGKKVKKISDEVYEYTVLPNGKVLYLIDYSRENCKGDLYQWDGGKAKKVDEDVVAVLNAYNYEK